MESIEQPLSQSVLSVKNQRDFTAEILFAWIEDCGHALTVESTCLDLEDCQEVIKALEFIGL